MVRSNVSDILIEAIEGLTDECEGERARHLTTANVCNHRLADAERILTDANGEIQRLKTEIAILKSAPSKVSGAQMEYILRNARSVMTEPYGPQRDICHGVLVRTIARMTNLSVMKTNRIILDVFPHLNHKPDPLKDESPEGAKPSEPATEPAPESPFNETTPVMNPEDNADLWSMARGPV